MLDFGVSGNPESDSHNVPFQERHVLGWGVCRIYMGHGARGRKMSEIPIPTFSGAGTRVT